MKLIGEHVIVFQDVGAGDIDIDLSIENAVYVYKQGDIFNIYETNDKEEVIQKTFKVTDVKHNIHTIADIAEQHIIIYVEEIKE